MSLEVHLFYYSGGRKTVESMQSVTETTIFFFFLSFCLFAISWAASVAYGGSQAGDELEL